jgi:NADH/NAD ratio-sensing transcriptional regulator Rex
MNGYEYRQDAVIFDERLKQDIAKIQRDFKNGNIKTQTDYAYAIKALLMEFYKNLGKPSFKYYPAGYVPSYTEYTDMISRAKNDMNTVLTGTSSNYTNLTSSKQKTDDSVNVLVNRLEGVISIAETLQNKINAIRRAADVVFSDDFTENKSSGTDVSGAEAYIDTTNGVLMLGINKNKSVVNNNIEVEILDTSNGFPGNTHEIYNSIGTVNQNIKFKGENAPHLDLNLVKSSHGEKSVSNDWFEFEMFNVSDKIQESTCMIGFHYKEGVSWISDEDELRLDIKFTLASNATSNYIILKGAPKSNANVSNPIIYQLDISDEDTIVQTVDVNQELVGTVILPFECQDVKTITVRLRQSEYLATKVCRQYMLNVDPSKQSKFLDDSFKGFIEIDDPTQSVELLGLKYDNGSGKIIYPNTSTTTTFLDSEYLKSQLFYNTQAKNNYKLKQEAVDAFRYCIGIGEVDIRYRKYVENGTYISKTFTSDKPIKQLTLNSTDFIPQKFLDLPDAKNTDFIKYYISFDNGNEWVDIAPRHKAQDGPCSIVVNSATAILNRNPNVTYYDTLNDPVNFKVKIEIKRPSEIVDETPIVYDYHVDITTREDF